MDLSSATVAVTGASGFIGRYLVRGLLARRAKVVAVVRNPTRLADLSVPALTIKTADLADRDALTAAFSGTDAIINNAAFVSVAHADRQTYLQANLKGVENVFRAAHAAHVFRMVHMSSAVAYRKKPGHRYDESDPLWADTDPSHRFSHYAVSKGAGERAAWALAHQLNLVLSTARPHTVYGAHDRGTFSIWLERFMKWPITVWPAYLKLPSIYAGDLAEAILRMLERPAAHHKAYNLACSADQISYWNLMQAYRKAGGGRARLVVPIPVPVTLRYTTDRAQQDLAFTPRPLHAAFSDMLSLQK